MPMMAITTNNSTSVKPPRTDCPRTLQYRNQFIKPSLEKVRLKHYINHPVYKGHSARDPRGGSTRPMLRRIAADSLDQFAPAETAGIDQKHGLRGS